MTTSSEFRVLVCGGRSYPDQAWVFTVLDELNQNVRITQVIHGASGSRSLGQTRGADLLAALWAEARHVPVKAFPADWRRFGRRAGPIRNAVMLDTTKPHLVIAFPGGRGTESMVRLATAAGVRVLRIP